MVCIAPIICFLLLYERGYRKHNYNNLLDFHVKCCYKIKQNKFSAYGKSFLGAYLKILSIKPLRDSSYFLG